MATRRFAFSLHPPRIPIAHLRRCVIDNPPRKFVLQGSRTKFTVTKNQTTGANLICHGKQGNETTKGGPNLRWSGETNLVARSFQAYENAGKQRPYIVQSCTSLAIWLSADILAQQIGAEEYDATQTARMLLIGGAASVPMYRW